MLLYNFRVNNFHKHIILDNEVETEVYIKIKTICYVSKFKKKKSEIKDLETLNLITHLLYY